MRDESVARNYALTLIDLADRHEGPEVYGSWIAEFAGMLDADPRLRLFLETPRIDAAQKKVVLRTALGDQAPRHFLSFLLITIDKRRQRLLRVINEEYQELLDERLGRKRVDVTLAAPIDDEGLARVSERLSVLLGRVALPQVRIRPEILGGIIVKSGDTIYDGSIRHRLDGLRRWMLKAELPALVADDTNSPKE